MGQEKMKITADTDVLIRAAVQDEPQQAHQAAKVLQEADLVAVPISCPLWICLGAAIDEKLVSGMGNCLPDFLLKEATAVFRYRIGLFDVRGIFVRRSSCRKNVLAIEPLLNFRSDRRQATVPRTAIQGRDSGSGKIARFHSLMQLSAEGMPELIEAPPQARRCVRSID